MIPLRLVIDTNILVSAALKPDGLQRTVLVLAITKPARLFHLIFEPAKPHSHVLPFTGYGATGSRTDFAHSRSSTRQYAKRCNGGRARSRAHHARRNLAQSCLPPRGILESKPESRVNHFVNSG